MAMDIISTFAEYIANTGYSKLPGPVIDIFGVGAEQILAVMGVI